MFQADRTAPLGKVFRFKIVLTRVASQVWRLIEVPSDYSFWSLHVAIQDAMGWRDCHLHEFTIEDPRTLRLTYIGIPSENFSVAGPFLPDWEAKLSNFFSEENRSAAYRYHFGDDWNHLITLEEVAEPKTDLTYPRCLGGEYACPPEDCGGPRGYEKLLEALDDPDHPKHCDVLERLGKAFDPSEFEQADVQFSDPEFRLKRLLRQQKSIAGGAENSNGSNT